MMGIDGDWHSMLGLGQIIFKSNKEDGLMPYPNEKRKPNSLIHSKSPYLLQHAYNPVDWMEWSAEAFRKAKRENKAVFVSIGYS